jgi:hypothetical protein
MTPGEFRELALELPEAVEGHHMDHPDFRVGGKIFATLWPGEGRGVVSLTTDDQRLFTASHPDTFVPVPGGWGRKGATSVILDHADEAAVRRALFSAWKKRAPNSIKNR